MRSRALWLLPVVPLVVGLVAVIRPGEAADHLDAPLAVADPASDITDVYAFMRPEPDGSGGYLPSTHLVMVMNVMPLAGTTSQFSNSVTYTFRLRRINSLSADAGP